MFLDFKLWSHFWFLFYAETPTSNQSENCLALSSNRWRISAPPLLMVAQVTVLYHLLPRFLSWSSGFVLCLCLAILHLATGMILPVPISGPAIICLQPSMTSSCSKPKIPSVWISGRPHFFPRVPPTVSSAHHHFLWPWHKRSAFPWGFITWLKQHLPIAFWNYHAPFTCFLFTFMVCNWSRFHTFILQLLSYKWKLQRDFSPILFTTLAHSS